MNGVAQGTARAQRWMLHFRRAVGAAGAVWAGAQAVGGPIAFVSHNGEVTSYCGPAAGGPLVDHRFLTIAPVHDSVSVTHPGTATLPASSASASMDVLPVSEGPWGGLFIGETGASARGPASPNVAAATGDARDFWQFTIASASCFVLTVTMHAEASETPLSATHNFTFSASFPARIDLTGGPSVTSVSRSLTTGNSAQTFSGTLQPGTYFAQLFGRVEGSSSPYTGSFTHWFSLEVGGPTLVSGPGDASACVGGSASFSVTAAGGGAHSLIWQVENPGAPGGWTNLPEGAFSIAGLSGVAHGVTTGSMAIDVTASATGVHRVRCGVSNECARRDSDAATLTVPAAGDPACGCACPADFDGSGGTPDAVDIDVFFGAWLAGDPSADCDCSGGTPDAVDIDVFFAAWLAGGC